MQEVYENRLPYVLITIVCGEKDMYISETEILTNNNRKTITTFDEETQRISLKELGDFIGYRVLEKYVYKDDVVKETWGFINSVDYNEEEGYDLVITDTRV